MSDISQLDIDIIKRALAFILVDIRADYKSYVKNMKDVKQIEYYNNVISKNLDPMIDELLAGIVKLHP